MTTDRTGTVVAGVDGSPESAAALARALDDAARRGARLRVVTAVRIPEYWDTAYRKGAPPPPPEIVESIRESAREAAQRTVDEVLTAAGERAARVPATVDVVTGAPSAVLVEASRGVDHLVLGHRGRGRIASAVLGSVGLQCVLHAGCPVTIVPPVAHQSDAGGRGLVVVGVDGSESSRAALEHAMGDAERRGARVRVVTASPPPMPWPVGYGMASAVMVPPNPEELVAAAERTARETLSRVVDGDRFADVPVEVRTAAGAPAEVLLDQARDADLLVLGHRGRGGFASISLGSVGLQCLLHATCPATIVRGRD